MKVRWLSMTPGTGRLAQRQASSVASGRGLGLSFVLRARLAASCSAARAEVHWQVQEKASAARVMVHRVKLDEVEVDTQLLDSRRAMYIQEARLKNCTSDGKKCPAAANQANSGTANFHLNQ